ncbi:hypothetical protein GCM10007977_025770 [Dactylosporangium sucinum]|uniref:Uncharacterized protein n=1 Tax=Dactylosporangium sucinum TaxID=1424081 RepID=A0A917THS0_9ACTN|nr:hypothetical protein GCM10007977_025770 [Dactylosporangium sucinum]
MLFAGHDDALDHGPPGRADRGEWDRKPVAECLAREVVGAAAAVAALARPSLGIKYHGPGR